MNDYPDQDGLKTEIQRATGGGLPESVAVILRDDALPRTYITDSSGLVTTKTVSYPDLLAALDGSSVVEALDGSDNRRLALPELPPDTLLVDLHESPAGRTYTFTGYLQPQTYLLSLEGNGSAAISTFEVTLPAVVYRALYSEHQSAVKALSLALCSPELQDPPSPQTALRRFPLSNVFHNNAGGAAPETVCWPALSQRQMYAREIPRAAVRAFLELPGNDDLYGSGLSHNGPQRTYRELLEHLAEHGVPEEYLLPAGLTVETLHTANRGGSR